MSDTLTHLRTLLQAGTPGELRARLSHALKQCKVGFQYNVPDADRCILCEWYAVKMNGGTCGSDVNGKHLLLSELDANATLLVALHNAAPALLDVVEAAQELIAPYHTASGGGSPQTQKVVDALARLAVVVREGT